jgi:hypothetical protein
MVANIRDAVPPRGYITSVDALLRIAKARHTDRWHRGMLHAKEDEIYSGLGRKYKADFLELELRTQIPQAEMEGNRAIAERFFDFNDAVYDLQTALHAGDLIGEYCDERGEFGWIKSAGWGGDNARVNLLRGTVELEDGWIRLILFKIESIDKLANQTDYRSGKAGRPGRKKGQGSLDGIDSPLIEEMRGLLRAGSAASPEAAAKKVAGKAHGTSTLESKVDRLAKRYRKRYGSE